MQQMSHQHPRWSGNKETTYWAHEAGDSVTLRMCLSHSRGMDGPT